MKSAELHPGAGAGRAVPLPGGDGCVEQPAVREDYPPLHGADSIPTQPLHQVHRGSTYYG